MTQHVKRLWLSIIFEPFSWLVLAFFQPSKFSRMYEKQDMKNRGVSMLRLILPLFLTSYIILLAARFIRYSLFSVHLLYVYNPFPGYFWFIPSYAILLSTALSLFLGLIGSGIRFGITFGIGSSISFTMLSTFIRSFDPSATALYDFSFVLLSMFLLTGFAIGLLFACAFAVSEGEPADVTTSTVRCIGFGIAFLVIFFHLENVTPKEFVTTIIDPTIIPAGIMGCASAGIALTIAGDVAIPSKMGIRTVRPGKVTQAATNGVIFGVFFVFALIPFASISFSQKSTNNLLNLLMVSLIVGFISSFLLSKKGTIVRIIIFILALFIIFGGVLNIFSIPFINTISLSTSSLSFLSYALGGIAFGAVAGCISGRVDRSLYLVLLLVVISNIVLSGEFASALSISILYSITVGVISGVVVSVVINNIKGVEGSSAKIVAFILALIATNLIINSFTLLSASYSAQTNLFTILIICTGCLVGYMFLYERLLFYPISSFSTLKVYFESRKRPPEVFRLLHHSGLYWDEKVSLPLPYLKHCLHLAMEQDIEQALRVIIFIIRERPRQIRAARPMLLEIVLRDLKTRTTLSTISTAFLRLSEIFVAPEMVDPRWIASLSRLSDASRDATSFSNALGRRNKYKALEDMRNNLNAIFANKAFRDVKLNKQMKGVVDLWLSVVQYEQNKLETAPEEIGYIDNPYVPGPALQLQTTLFVGRRDLVRQLEIALSKDSHRPTFFLTGERRMGKSSTLNQLPHLLGARYIPVTYDLQVRGISSSTSALLSTLAEEMYLAMNTRGILAKKLEYSLLRDASRENEAAPYYIFDHWLKETQQLLKQYNRVLLLAFDEFEKLQEAEQEKYLSIKLLLDWFRGAIQNHSQLAFLFSGVRTFGDMGPEWANCFVSVQTLKVSFLSPSEARRLITKPVPSYPSEQLFDQEVIDEIINITGCHPFLLQAVCSALIDHLNTTNSDRAKLSDVTEAVERVLENWWDTYFRDLWERTTLEERASLKALRETGLADIQRIAERGRQDERTIKYALNMLIKRDLVVFNNNQNYRIAAPIFEQWVKRSNDN